MTTTRAVLNQSKKDVAGLYIDAFQTCLIFLMPIDKFYLVYWEEEDSVTVVGASAVQQGNVGEREMVKIGREQYEGKLVATGRLCECSWIRNHTFK